MPGGMYRRPVLIARSAATGVGGPRTAAAATAAAAAVAGDAYAGDGKDSTPPGDTDAAYSARLLI